MIKNYNEFNKMNEGVIGDFVKKVFKGLISDIKEDFKKPLEEFTKKASKTTDPKRMKQIVIDYLKDNYETLNKTMEEVKTLPDIHKTISDNLKAIYGSITAVNDTIGNFEFEEIFKDVKDKNSIKLFTKGAKYFDKNVKSFTSNLLMKFDSSIDKNKLKEIEKAKTNESLIIEADELSQTEQQDAIDNTDPNKEENKETQNKQEGQEEKTQETDYSNVKKNIMKWFNYTIYEPVKNNLDFEEKEGNSSDDINKNIENNPLDNKDGIKKILNKISEIKDAKQMAAVRDTLIGFGLINKDDIGVF